MKFNTLRFKSAAKAMGWHFGVSVLVALAALVFAAWYPYPYRELSGGRELFFLSCGLIWFAGRC